MRRKKFWIASTKKAVGAGKVAVTPRRQWHGKKGEFFQEREAGSRGKNLELIGHQELIWGEVLATKKITITNNCH